MQVTVKTFAPLVSNHFSLSLKRNKVMENHEKEAKHGHASAADLSDIRIGNVDWWKCGYCKKEATEVDCFCCREVNAISDKKFEGIAKRLVFS